MAETIEPVVLGYEPGLQINDIPFGITGADIEHVYQEHECGDSINGVRNEMWKRGRERLQGSVQFIQRTDVDYFVPTLELSIDDAEQVKLELFTMGFSEDPWEMPQAIVNNFKISWNKDGKAEGSFTFKSSGEFTKPGE